MGDYLRAHWPSHHGASSTSNLCLNAMSTVRTSHHHQERKCLGVIRARIDCEQLLVEIDKRISARKEIQLQLKAAIFQEDYKSARALHTALAELALENTASSVLRALEVALTEERYEDASYLRDEAGAGLVDTWMSDDHIVEIAEREARFVASLNNIPIFEVFVSKKGLLYETQAMFLQGSSPEAAELVSGAVYTSPQELDRMLSSVRQMNAGLCKMKERFLNDGRQFDSRRLEGLLIDIFSTLLASMPALRMMLLSHLVMETGELEATKLQLKNRVPANLELVNKDAFTFDVPILKCLPPLVLSKVAAFVSSRNELGGLSSVLWDYQPIIPVMNDIDLEEDRFEEAVNTCHQEVSLLQSKRAVVFMRKK